jgi:hypothetical protein
MSCFMVHHDHIDLLVTAAKEFGTLGGIVLSDDLNAFGRDLLEANARSVAARYREPVGNEPAMYRHRPLSLMTHPHRAVQIIKACDCFEYQSCEADDRRTKETLAKVDAIRSAAIHSLPGYSAAAWSFTREALRKTA